VAAAKGAGSRPGAGEDVDLARVAAGRSARRGRREQQQEGEQGEGEGAAVGASGASVLPVPRNLPAPMRARTATLAALVMAAVAVTLALVFGGSEESETAAAETSAVPGEPTVAIISPRNGARQSSRAVVVKVDVENFQLAPRRFGGEPQLGEGHIRFGLNRVPDCVDPIKLQHAINSPLGSGRLVGASFDYPDHAGPNGVLAERVGSAGSYSPATRPEIFYYDLPPGFYRLIVNLAQNNGATTRFHDVTNFQILQPAGHTPKNCSQGKVPSAKAAARLR
jgi:hypothetical protein